MVKIMQKCITTVLIIMCGIWLFPIGFFISVGIIMTWMLIVRKRKPHSRKVFEDRGSRSFMPSLLARRNDGSNPGKSLGTAKKSPFNQRKGEWGAFSPDY